MAQSSFRRICLRSLPGTAALRSDVGLKTPYKPACGQAQIQRACELGRLDGARKSTQHLLLGLLLSTSAVLSVTKEQPAVGSQLLGPSEGGVTYAALLEAPVAPL